MRSTWIAIALLGLLAFAGWEMQPTRAPTARRSAHLPAVPINDSRFPPEYPAAGIVLRQGSPPKTAAKEDEP
jgi:hypothetical protein